MTGTIPSVLLLLTNVKNATVHQVAASFPSLKHHSGEASVDHFGGPAERVDTKVKGKEKGKVEGKAKVKVVDGVLHDPQPIPPFGTRVYQFNLRSVQLEKHFSRSVKRGEKREELRKSL